MTKKWISFISSTCLALTVCSVALAKTQVPAPKRAELKLPAESFQILEDSAMGTLIKQAHARGKVRNVASADELVSESQMSPELKKFRDRLLQAKTPDDVAGEIAYLENGYTSFPTDLRYFATQFIPIKAFRGIVYRLAPLAQKENITDSALVTAVQRLTEQYNVHFTSNHSRALLDYMIAPYATQNGIVAQIKSTYDLQSFLVSDVYPLVAQALDRLQKMEIGKQDIVWDNKIVYGTTAFIDDIQRYKVLGDVDRYAVIAQLHFALANLSQTCAYNLESLSALVKAEGKLIGVDGFLFAKVDGASTFDRVKIVKEARFNSLFTLMNNGVGWSRRSLTHVQQGLKYTRLVWEEIKNRPAQEYAVMNSAKILPWEKNIEVNLTMAENLLKGKTQVRSAVSGETIVVDVPAFFMNPPTDLKTLLPIGFELGDKNAYANLSLAGKRAQVKYRNYYYGQANNWNTEAYRTLFPELKNGQDIKKAMKIFSETWNGTQVTILPVMN